MLLREIRGHICGCAQLHAAAFNRIQLSSHARVPTRCSEHCARLCLPALTSTCVCSRRRLWIAFHSYGQYPAKYGQGAAGFGGYFGNQSAAWHSCVSPTSSATTRPPLDHLSATSTSRPPLAPPLGHHSPTSRPPLHCRCASRHGVRPCALRFEGHGPEQAERLLLSRLALG